MLSKYRMKSRNPNSKRPVYLFALGWPVQAVGGVNEVVLSLAQQLQKDSSYEPMIAVFAWDPAPAPDPCRGIPVVNLKVGQPVGSWPICGWFLTLPKILWDLAAFLRKHRVEVVNFHFPGLHALSFFILRWIGGFRGELLLSFHGSDFRILVEPAPWFYRILWKLLIRRADGVVACSEKLQRDILAFVPRATRIVTIHNGIDFCLFAQARRPHEERRQILHVGKFEHQKGQDLLLLAFSRLLKSFSESRLILVGAPGPTLEQTKTSIAELGLEAHIEMHINVPHDQMPQFFARADLFVLPSRAEAFPLVLLEAGAAGLPVVATAVGGVPEAINDGVTGLLVPSGDVTALEAAMRQLLTDQATADRLASNLHEKVRATWSWEKTSEKYLALIESCRRPRGDV